MRSPLISFTYLSASEATVGLKPEGSLFVGQLGATHFYLVALVPRTREGLAVPFQHPEEL